MSRSVAHLAAAVLATIVTASCARVSTGASDAATIEHPTGRNDVVLRWESVGGFIAPQAQLGRIPAFSLYEDGLVITEGPQIEINRARRCRTCWSGG
jgi:hypothetical protein